MLFSIHKTNKSLELHLTETVRRQNYFCRYHYKGKNLSKVHILISKTEETMT